MKRGGGKAGTKPSDEIETLKHQWLFLSTLDSVAGVRRHVSCYVAAHNGQVPHSAFRGQTPDEMYFGTGREVPERLDADSRAAQAARLEKNRTLACEVCLSSSPESAKVSTAA